MSSRGFPLPMRQVAMYAFVLVALFGVYHLSFGSDVGYFRDSAPPAANGQHDTPPPPKQHPEGHPPRPPPVPVVATAPAPEPTRAASSPATDPDPGVEPVEPLEPPKPGEVKIVGLVFFGRRDLVRVLDCYLKRNLKDNGGLFDEVIFTINTGIQEDLDYLDNELLPSSPRYRKYKADGNLSGSWLGQWSAVDERDTIYVKIDDDVVFFEDNTVASVVQPLVDNPSYFAVSANVVNNPAMAWVHYHLGVFEPYWPEMKKPSKPSPPGSWRPSELPDYDGPAEGPTGFKIDGSSPAPFAGHRWLPVRHKDKKEHEDPTKFPASTLTYDAFGPSLKNWAATAQLHFSFLQHLEKGETSRYKFGMWDYHYDRISINFFAVRGGDIMDVYPFPNKDDEGFLTVEHPKKIGKHVVVAGEGLAVHFAFGPQRWAHEGHGMTDTDLLGRYTAYANEMVCPFPTRQERASPLVRPESRRRRRALGTSR